MHFFTGTSFCYFEKLQDVLKKNKKIPKFKLCTFSLNINDLFIIRNTNR